MERLNRFSRSAELVETSQRRNILIAISAPYEEANGFWCDVSVPGLLERSVRIAGLDAMQARALSFGFINRLVASLDAALIDDDGKRITFDESYEPP